MTISTSHNLTNYTEVIVKSKYLSDHSSVDQGWDHDKFANYVLSRMYDYGKINYKKFEKYSFRLDQCASILGYNVYYKYHDESVNYKLHTASFCRIRNCPVCQGRRAMKMRSKFFKIIPELDQDYAYLFLTLTVPNCKLSDLRSTIDHMSKSWHRMMNLKLFKSASWFKGWFRSVEVTRSVNHKIDDERSLHPHYHVLIAVNKTYFNKGVYLSQDDWTQLWKKALRLDVNPVVNVKRVRVLKDELLNIDKEHKEDQREDVDKMKSMGIRKAVLEVCKYAVKPSDLLGEKYRKLKLDDINTATKDFELFDLLFDFPQNQVDMFSEDLKKEMVESEVKFLYQFTEQLQKLRFHASGGMFKELLKQIEDEYEDDDLIYISGVPHDDAELDRIAESSYGVDRNVDRYVLRKHSVDIELVDRIKQDELKNK